MSDFKNLYLTVSGADETEQILKEFRKGFGERGVDWDFLWIPKHSSICFQVLPGSKANTILCLKYGDKLTTTLTHYSNNTGFHNTAIGVNALLSNTTGNYNIFVGPKLSKTISKKI